MKQILQNFRTGKIMVEEVPAPICRDNGILVQTVCSLISVGTERSTVQVGQASMVGKARRRPDLVKQVLENMQREGVQATISKVTSRLDTWKALGYSAAGVVVESRCQEFKSGDRVACAGQDLASHAEYIAVPKLLACHIPEGVQFEDAAYTTLGAIALQGVRQSDVRLGENVVVIGLGLLGLLTCQLLKSAGCRVVGIDISERNFVLAKELGCDHVFALQQINTREIEKFGFGLGADSVLITAASPSSEPVELAMQLCRKRGRVVVVGDVIMNIPRVPFYEKEIDFRISCSYGPGRYDTEYEQKGRDYPAAYVRWTEQRNMAAFLDLIQQGRMDVKRLTTHVFELQDALQAYDLVTGKKREPHLGILFRYPLVQVITRTVTVTGTANSKRSNSRLRLGVIGAGNFAKAHLLPHFNSADIDWMTVADMDGANAKATAAKFGFRSAVTDSQQVLQDADIDAVVIATRHDSHASLTAAALQQGKHVYVEKPLALSHEELDAVVRAAANSSGILQVGFNRRSSPMAVALKKYFMERTYPLAINIRVNAGYLPPEYWLNDDEFGGGRLRGEACHFIDLAQFFVASPPQGVKALATGEPHRLIRAIENFVVTLRYADGSVAVIQYYSNGSKKLAKELIEVYGGDKTAVIDDFRACTFYDRRSDAVRVAKGKGHAEEVRTFIDSCLGRCIPLYSLDELRCVSQATLSAFDSLSIHEEIMIC
jgi:predicted dehydrogenase/threonine dehydrogenase-like Zn-dependent dehydrogenase